MFDVDLQSCPLVDRGRENLPRDGFEKSSSKSRNLPFDFTEGVLFLCSDSSTDVN